MPAVRHVEAKTKYRQQSVQAHWGIILRLNKTWGSGHESVLDSGLTAFCCWCTSVTSAFSFTIQSSFTALLWWDLLCHILCIPLSWFIFLLWHIFHLLEVFENELMESKFLNPCMFENAFILSSCLIESFAWVLNSGLEIIFLQNCEVFTLLLLHVVLFRHS